MSKPVRSLPLALLFAGLLVAAGATAVMRGGADLETDRQGPVEVVAASFTSAWCSSCKVLAPRLARVIPGYDGRSVAFVEFDFTFGRSEALASAAREAGVEEAYLSAAGATGFTLLIDAETGIVLDTLTMNHSADAMRAAIDRALAIASSTDDRA